MHIADIDYISTHGRSIFHQAKPISKVIFTVCLLSAAIISKSIAITGAIIILMMILTTLARVPVKQILHLLAYPIIFSSIFAILIAGQSMELGALLILRAVGAAFILVFLVLTTSYVDLFSFFSLFMPGILVDIFIFTYRSLFILLESTSHLFRSIRLRGGYHPLRFVMNLKNMASMVGILIIHSLEMSERMYHIYALRGYQGAMPLRRVSFYPLKWNDLIIISIGVMSLVGTVVVWSL